MKAYIYQNTGPAADVLTLREMVMPAPGAGEVRVRLKWSGVNPSDVKTRSGHIPSTIPFPRIPHSDGAGLVDMIGDGVDDFQPGDAVWVWNAAWNRSNGTAAEFVVLPSEQVEHMPDGLALENGACLGIPAMTACHAVATDGGVRGQIVLVAGGAGAVGHYAIQAAKFCGARIVIATVSSEEKEALARRAGADFVFNYKTDTLVDEINKVTDHRGVDRIIEVDLAANIQTDVAIMKEGGLAVIYGSSQKEIALPFSPSIGRNICYRFFIVYKLSRSDRQRALLVLQDMLKDKNVLHNIAKKVSFANLVEAHELVESGALPGNVVLRIE